MSSVGRVQLTVVERLWSEVMNQRTERHAVIPARREVGNVHVLTHTYIQLIAAVVIVVVVARACSQTTPIGEGRVNILEGQ